MQQHKYAGIMRWFALILCLWMPSWGWAENYLCIPEKAVGLLPDDNFQATFFKPTMKYIVSTEKKTLTLFGRDVPHVDSCEITTGVVNCDDDLTQFTIHRRNLKFMVYHMDWAYVWADETEFAKAPMIAIGTCTKF